MEWIIIATGVVALAAGWLILNMKPHSIAARKSAAAARLERMLFAVSPEASVGGQPVSEAAKAMIDDVFVDIPSLLTAEEGATPHVVSVICRALSLAISKTEDPFDRHILMSALSNAIFDAQKNQSAYHLTMVDDLLIGAASEHLLSLHPADMLHETEEEIDLPMYIG